ncbi:MAG: DUF4388 domain-containing protein [bacterium]|nr:DUF4388 domain-containing protein [bacterium]MDT8364863.1 DUF4388 domain-containing protein [bacterium]
MNREQNSGTQGSSSAVLDPTMSLVGRLEDLSLGEILQIVSLSKRSGLLRLEAPDGKASLYIRAGKVIYAASSDEKESVLTLLAENGLIEANQLESIREKLDSASSPQEFRDLLGIGHDSFQEVLKTRVEELTYSLFMWEEGTFSFQLIEDENTHPLLFKVAPFFLDEGIGAQFLVMEGARRKDEMLRDAVSEEVRDRSSMVDPGSVLGDNWENEFEQHLTGSAGSFEEATPEEGLAEELGEFVVPETLPQLPGVISGKVVAVGLQVPFVVEITGSFVRAGIELLLYENGADALVKIQELRQQGINPYLLTDLEASGITDGRAFGGLEIVSTMWDFGFHLPVGLVCRREIQEELGAKLQTVTGLTIFPASEKIDKSGVQRIVETITGAMSNVPEFQEEIEEASTPEISTVQVLSLQTPQGHQHPPAVPVESPADDTPGVLQDVEQDVQMAVEPVDNGEEYYDIEQEFSDELSDIDLPLDGTQQTQAPPQKASSDPYMARLSSYVNELNRQDISGEITLLALRFASAFANRAILFLIRKNDIKGLGQFGVDLGQDINADSVVRSLNLPLEENSIFQWVTENRQSYKGPPTGSSTEFALFEALGGSVPGEIFLGPIVSMGKVAVLLYGDNYPQRDGLEPTHTLDIFLSHVGLALDRAFLEMKLKSQRS